MRITKRSLVLALSGLTATSVITGVGMTTQQVLAQPDSEAPTIDELYVPPPAPANVPLTPAALDFVQRTTGKLYVRFKDGESKEGTATVVASESRDMLLTEGRLLLNERNERPTEVRFVPGERLIENIPASIYGWWTARNWATMPGFQYNSPHWAQNNIAVVLLNTRNEQHIEKAVNGAQGICFNCPLKGHVHVYAYHKGYDGGFNMDTTCQVIADFSVATQPYGTCIEGNPAFATGPSGGPIIANVDPKTGLGMVAAINTWVAHFPDGRRSNGGAVIGAGGAALYNGYRAQ